MNGKASSKDRGTHGAGPRKLGSDARGAFDEAVANLKIQGYFFRVKTPTDNPVDERFNRTLEEEFIQT